VGKAVTVSVKDDPRVYQEIWPARVEAVSGALPETPGPDGVFARCSWQPAAALRPGKRFYVFRDGGQLAEAMGIRGPTAAETATALLAERLGVPAIDWKKHVVITVCAGLKGKEADQLHVVQVTAHEQVNVFYELKASGQAAGFGYPAETVLVPRHAGPVQCTFTEKPK
jgi:hypothetical protein